MASCPPQPPPPSPAPTFPPEIKAAVFALCDQATLAILCLVSLETLELAGPLLYARIELHTLRQAQLLFCDLAGSIRSDAISPFLSLSHTQIVISHIPNSLTLLRPTAQPNHFFSRARLPSGRSLPIQHLTLTAGLDSPSYYSTRSMSMDFADLFSPVRVDCIRPPAEVARFGLPLDISPGQLVVCLGSDGDFRWVRLAHLSLWGVYAYWPLGTTLRGGASPVRVQIQLSRKQLYIEMLGDQLYGSPVEREILLVLSVEEEPEDSIWGNDLPDLVKDVSSTTGIKILSLPYPLSDAPEL